MKTNIPPKVSVIIPAYNEEKYIVQTLQAVLNQNYPDFEVIIVNNASTDKTEEVLKEFIATLDISLQQIITLCYEAKQGTNHAREHARRLAKGTIIAQLDADCVPHKNWMLSGVKLFKKKNIVAATGAYYYFDATFFMRTTSLISQLITYPFINSTVQLAKRGGILIGGNSFINASILEKVGGYNTDLTFYGDDVDIAAKVATHGWIEYSGKLILNSSSRRYKALGFWKVNKKYQDCFWNIVFKRSNNIFHTIELNHPR
jgi:cellulose synthase/poly-beta-1,6-N-acetylglucosamine synthase-like glycosyltransferase